MVHPFSYQRLWLVFTWIGFSFIVTFLNSRFYPDYNNSTAAITISILCLVNAAYLFTRLIGINKRVSRIEFEQNKKEFHERNRAEIDAMKRQIKFQSAFQPNNKEEHSDIKEFQDNVKSAEGSWRSKKKRELNLFEQEQYLIHRIHHLNNINLSFSMLLSIIFSLMILNPFFFSTKLVLVFIAVLMSILGMLWRKSLLSRKLESIQLSIYPESIKAFIKQIDAF